MKYASVVLISLFAVAIPAGPLAAQNLQGLGSNAPNLNVYVSPAHPGPRQQVAVTLESFATDLDRASISWSLNDTAAKQGVGQKSFTFTTGAPGTASRVAVNIITTAGEVWQKTITIYPASVDLVWEAQSYTPPFYRGKALYPYQGTVRIVAMPDIVAAGGTEFDPNNLVYNWQIDGNPAQSASGYGKNVFVFQGGIPLKSNTISVNVSSLDQKYSAEGQTTITPVAPVVFLYDEDPLLGTLFNKALPGIITLQNQEVDLTAIPYFSGNLKRDSLTYAWQMNNQDVAGGQSTLAFRQQNGAAGNASVAVQISNPSSIFQTASGSITLSFGNGAASSF